MTDPAADTPASIYLLHQHDSVLYQCITTFEHTIEHHYECWLVPVTEFSERQLRFIKRHPCASKASEQLSIDDDYTLEEITDAMAIYTDGKPSLSHTVFDTLLARPIALSFLYRVHRFIK